MTIASFEDTWRVRLLSMPQQRQAATTSNAWGESEAPPGCQERSTPPTTMATMPSTMCRSAFSLKTTHAITAVSTPSTLRSKDAVAPDVSVRPHNRSAGPSIPPNSTAPRSHGMSFFEIPTARAWSGLSQSCRMARSEEHTSELQSHLNLVCRLLLEKKKKISLSSVDTHEMDFR